MSGIETQCLPQTIQGARLKDRHSCLFLPGWRAAALEVQSSSPSALCVMARSNVKHLTLGKFLPHRLSCQGEARVGVGGGGVLNLVRRP